MNSFLLRTILPFSLMLALCAGGMAAIFLSGSRSMAYATDLVTHTHQVIQETQELINDANRMLISQQRYILTNDVSFRDEYRNARGEMEKHIAALDSHTRDNVLQRARLRDIRGYADALAQILDGSPRDMRLYPQTLSTIDRLSADIMRVTLQLRNEEYRLLDIRVKRIEEERNRYVWSLLAGGVVSILLLFTLNAILLHSQTRRTRAERNLFDAEERLRLAMEGSHDGMFDWHIRTDVLVCSDRYWEILGYEPGEYPTTRQDVLGLIHPDDKEKSERKMKDCLSGMAGEYRNTFRLRHKSGAWVWVAARGKVARDARGNPVRLAGAITDVSESKAFQQKLTEAKIHAEHASQAKTEFLAHMSHEIRTPLTAISGIAEILQGGNQDNLTERQKKLVRTLGSSTEALKDLINDILDFSKIESGQVELENASFALKPVLDQVMGIMAVKAEEKGLSFRVEDDAIQSLVYTGDKVRFRQILMNLVGNAVKFTEQGHVAIHATVIGNPGGRSLLQIDVSDTGIGIHPDHAELIFERFRQADSSVSRRFGGTGLGLPISRRLARLMGGELTVRSQEGQGSVFTILLPLGEAASVPAQENPQSGTSVMETGMRAIPETAAVPARVLLAEDYEGNIVMLGYLLDTLSCVYDVARTGTEAIGLAAARHYDLVIMDIQMPETDGLAATRLIRAREAAEGTRPVPIIGMTAHASIGDREACLSAGMNDYLPKPIAEGDFRQKVLALLAVGPAGTAS